MNYVEAFLIHLAKEKVVSQQGIVQAFLEDYSNRRIMEIYWWPQLRRDLGSKWRTQESELLLMYETALLEMRRKTGCRVTIEEER